MTHNIIMSGKFKKVQFFLFIFIFFSTNIFSIELDLLCTQNTTGISNHIYPRDLIVRINSDSNQVNIGGLTISTENLEVSESNIKWSNAKKENMFGENEHGLSSGLLGRFSGILSLEFLKISSNSKSNLNYQCENFKIKNRRF